jgi:methionyl-tRNA formyltransferase
MRIVFFGSPSAALPSLEALLAAGHEITLVVTQPDKPAGRGRRLAPSPVKALAAERHIPAIGPARIRTDPEAAERIREARPDISIVVAYGQIIPREIHFFPRYHSLNVHFSLLPKYRGAAPVQWAVLKGEARSGVTIIELNDRMDEGDILAQEEVPVGPRESAAALEARLAEVGAGLLVSTLALIDEVPHVPQDHARATLAPTIRKDDGLVSWAEPAAAIDRKVLALAERPGVFTWIKGRRVNILRGRAIERPEGSPAQAPRDPGTVLSVDKTGLEAACGAATAYLIEELQPEGKGRMSAHAFLLGTRINPGDVLGN